MARKPQTIHPQDILAAAAAVMRRKGCEAATMKDIAAEVNLTAASLYHHFKNKDLLLLAVLESGIDRTLSQIEPTAQSNAPCADKLRAMIVAHVLCLIENPALELRHMTADNTLDSEFAARQAVLLQKQSHLENLFRQVIQAGITSGEFCPVNVSLFTRMILSASNSFDDWHKDDDGLTDTQAVHLMTDVFLKALQ